MKIFFVYTIYPPNIEMGSQKKKKNLSLTTYTIEYFNIIVHVILLSVYDPS